MKHNFLVDNKKTEWAVWGLFIALYFIISFFHEPMYDEAQAWMIARDASWYELLFEIPHYEGHPPFWHLILALFAKTGISFEVGLRIPGAFCWILSVGILLFRSPFPKTVKYLLPFTYYIFFRFGIVVRPYCLTMLGLFLAATTYKEKGKKPFAFMASLLVLCASSAYGMALAAGICLVWIVELFTKYKSNYLKQVIALFVLLIFNLAQLFLMMPKDDTNSVAAFSFMTILYGLIYMFILGPADSMFMDAGMDARLQNYAEGIVTGGVSSYINLFIGFMTIMVLVYYAQKYRKLLLLIVPYTVFSLFSATVYFWYHHIGIIHLFLIFVFWCALDEKEQCKDSKLLKLLEVINSKNHKMASKMPVFALILCLGMSLAWNVFCSGTDLLKKTWYTKELTEGIKMVGADQYNCALQWDIMGVGPFENPEDYTDASKYYHVVSVTQFFDCLAYFDENIFYNHNGGNKDISYNMQRVPEADEQALILEEIATYGYPEFIIGHAFVLDALPIEEEMPNYVPVYRFEVYKPDKFIIDYNDRYIYAREDVYQQRSDWPIGEQLKLN